MLFSTVLSVEFKIVLHMVCCVVIVPFTPFVLAVVRESSRRRCVRTSWERFVNSDCFVVVLFGGVFNQMLIFLHFTGCAVQHSTILPTTQEI